MTWMEETMHLLEGTFYSATDSNRSTVSFMSLYLTIFLVETAIFCGVFLVWYKIKTKSKINSKNRREKIDIPMVSFFPFPVPDFMSGLYYLIGFKKDGFGFVQELISKYGTVFQVPFGFGLGRVSVVADPAIAQKILSSTNPNHLNKPKGIYEVAFPKELTNGLVTLEHEVWTKHRKVIAHSFSYSSLQAYLQIMNEHGEKLADKLLSVCASETGGVVQGKKVEELIWSETIKIILQTVMGKDCCSDEESAVIHNCFQRHFHITQHRFQNPHLLIPQIWWFHPNRAKNVRVFSTLRELLTEKIKRFREKKMDQCDTAEISTPSSSKDKVDEKETKQNCMIENMIRSGASDLEIYAEILTFVVAGHETTANAITVLLFHLACNPQCQSLCRDEISKLWIKLTSEESEKNSPQFTDVAQMKYLERCILEGLRMTPTVPGFFRRLDSKVEIEGELRFAEGTSVAISPWAIHHNPDIYPEPEKFDPDRFLPENTQKRHPYAYMPFSGGPRNCIGHKYAIMEIKVILAWLLHHFDVSTSVDPKTVKYFAEITLIPDRDLNIILKKR